MIKVCVLASGSKGNAIYVSDEKTSILVDAGLSGIEIERRLHSRNINPETLDAIVVSHEHTDHIRGVGVLSRRLRLPVYINEPTLTAAGAQLGPLHETRTFRSGASFTAGSFFIHPFSLPHDAADPVGFAIHDGITKIGIATDLGVTTQLVRHHLKECTMLIIEANHDLKMLEEGPYPWEVKQRIRSRLGHISNETCRDLLSELSGKELKHVIVAHMSEINNKPERAISVVTEAVDDSVISVTLARQYEAGKIIDVDTS